MSIQDSIDQITKDLYSIANEAAALGKYIPTVNPLLSLRNILNCRKHAHVVGWFGNTDHIDVGYNSQSYDTIAWQLDQIVAKGLDGVNVLFSGVAKKFTALTAQRFLKAADDRGLIVSVMIDHESIVTPDDFKWANDNLMTGRGYWKWNGKRVLFVFDSPQPAQLAALPSDIAFIYRNSGGISKLQSSGCFGWPAPGKEAAYCADFYANTKTAGKLVVPHVSPGFKGASWNQSPTFKPTPWRYGQEWLDSIQRVIASNTNPNDLIVATWNDYEEGTGIEGSPLL